ncbi:MAG: non-canonical purine NTP pyrophosphatase [Phycisphaeraceae bacterium]
MKILLATTNPHKRDEIDAVLGNSVELITLDEIDLRVPEPVEDGATFQANALLKAEYYGDAAAMPTLADDSGLAVDALNGEPGVYSARYAAAEHGDAWSSLDRAERDRINNAKLLRALGGVANENRAARFVCAMAMVIPPNAPEATGPPPTHWPGGDALGAGMNYERTWPPPPIIVEGTYPGRIIQPDEADDPQRPERGRGGNGFGYDPLLVLDDRYPDHAGRTSAELTPEQKNAVSHRGDAARQMRDKLAECMLL